MLIDTRDFGEVEVTEDELLTFPEGIAGFDDVKEYALLSPLGEDVFPKWLQSVDGVAPCFVVFDPSAIVDNYCVKLESHEKEKVERKLKFRETSDDNTNVGLLAIATVWEDYKKSTLNTKAPIVINRKEKLAMQVILSEPADGYAFKYPLFEVQDEVQVPEAGES